MNREDFDLAEVLDNTPTVPPATGTVDDDDDPNDEREDENEAPVGESNERTEAPEEFLKDDEDSGKGA